MNIFLIKKDLDLIKIRIDEYIKEGIVYATKPKLEYEKLFTDFNKISDKLRNSDSEIFDSIETSFFPETETRSSFNSTNLVYKLGNLKLLLFEVEKAIGYISIYQNEENVNAGNTNPLSSLNLISNRFHFVVKQLRKRYGEREPFNVEDEYDVQDLFHSILRIFFDDIRPENYSPEYGGGNSRIDFVLKQERIAIEIKKTRKSLNAKKLGEELIIDIARYSNHPDVDTLVCFVYDPDSWIDNPKGIETDLSTMKDGVNVIVRIEPK